MRVSSGLMLLGGAAALASLLWRPLILEPASYSAGPLPEPLVENNRITEQAQSFFQGQFVAPEHFAFSKSGDIYFGVHDGRILRTRADASGSLMPPELVVYTGEPGLADRGFPCGSEESENVCGRALGLAFDPRGDDSKLLVADCYLGLLEVDVRARSKTVLLNSVDGQPLYFANSLVVGSRSGTVYLTDSSARWRRRDFIWDVLESQATGRLIAFERSSRTARVLVQRVSFANGVLVDPLAERYLLFSELGRARVLRYDLAAQSLPGDGEGPIDAQRALAGVEDGRAASAAKRLTVAVANLPGQPDNLAWEQPSSRDAAAATGSHGGVFWIGAGSKRTQPFSLLDSLSQLPLARTVLAALLPKHTFLQLVPRLGLLLRVQMDADGQHGRIVDTLQDHSGRTALLTGAYEHEGFLYVGAISHDIDYLMRVPWTHANKSAASYHEDA